MTCSRGAGPNKQTNPEFQQTSESFERVTCSETVVPVFSGLCHQRTPDVYRAMYAVFQHKLTRNQQTPANADRHFVVIFDPQPADSALFILFFITLGCKRYRISLLMCIVSRKRMSTPADVHLGRSENEG